MSHFPPDISSNRTIIAWNKKLLIKTKLASNTPLIHNRICQRYEIEKQIPTPRTAEDEEQIDLEPEQLTLITQKYWKMQQARQASFARAVENGQFFFTNGSVVDGNSSSLPCRECSEPRNSPYSRLQTVLTYHVNIGPVTGIEVFKSAGTLVIAVPLSSQHQKIRILVCEHHE